MEGLFAAHAKAGLTDDAAVNFETNAATHTFGRALDEAAVRAISYHISFYRR